MCLSIALLMVKHSISAAAQTQTHIETIECVRASLINDLSFGIFFWIISTSPLWTLLLCHWIIMRPIFRSSSSLLSCVAWTVTMRNFNEFNAKMNDECVINYWRDRRKNFTSNRVNNANDSNEKYNIRNSFEWHLCVDDELCGKRQSDSMA